MISLLLPMAAYGLSQRTARPLQQTCFNAFNTYLADYPLSDQTSILLLEKLSTDLCPRTLQSIESKIPCYKPHSRTEILRVHFLKPL